MLHNTSMLTDKKLKNSLAIDYMSTKLWPKRLKNTTTTTSELKFCIRLAEIAPIHLHNAASNLLTFIQFVYCNGKHHVVM